jgi:malonate-semialdehyde dehydrogenase (acetylating)/methylmalonate-semialdehyde dehydrogenase
MQGYENGFYLGGCLFDNVTKDMRIYKEEIFGPVLSVVRAKDYERRWRCRRSRIRQRRRDLHPRRRRRARFRRQGQCRHGRHQRADPGADRLLHLRRLEASGFGDLNQHGPDSIRFYTKTKTVTSRWPSGVKEGAEFSIPTMN